MRKFLAGLCLALLISACASEPVVTPPAAVAPVLTPVPAVDIAPAMAVAATAPVGPPMSLAQLRSCAALRIAARQKRADLRPATAHLQAENQRLRAEQQALEFERASLAVSDYNTRLQKLRDDLQDYKLRVGLHKASQRNIGARNTQYNRDCAGRPYREQDLQYLSPAEQAAIGSGAMSYRLPPP